MTGTRINGSNQVEVVDRHKSRLIDLNHLQVADRIQIAPEPQKKQEEFRALTLAERQELLQKLINRVKSL